MSPDPEIRSKLVHWLYSAMPQVASSTLGTVLLAVTVWWRTPSLWTTSTIVAAICVAVIRLGTLVAYRRRNGDGPASPGEAVQWERVYGVFSIAMALVVAAVTLAAFVHGDSGVKLLTSGVLIGICGGQSTARVTCRPWIPITSGCILMLTLTICATIWSDPTWAVFAIFTVLYLYTYVEACQNGARIILGQLVAEQELAILASRDPLTGLANRAAFDDHLNRAFLAYRRNGGSVSLLLLDLDGFKEVNDQFGHPAGDAVLREVAARLRRLSRETDCLARLGGDEFAVLITDHHDRERLTAYARRLIDGISEPFNFANKSARVGVSIGIGVASQPGPREPTKLLAAADAALYNVKRTEKNNVAYAVAEAT